MTPMTLTRPAWRGRGTCAVAVRPGPPGLELWQLEGIDVQQRPRLGPLIAPGALRALGAALTTDAVTLEDLPDRRAVPTGQPRQTPRPVVRPRARIEDRPLISDAQSPRTRTRPRRTAAQTRQRDALTRRRRGPAMPPTMRG